MPELPDNINANNSILISRNRPVALIVGAAGFIGSHLVDAFLKKEIQVLGVDDLSEGEKKNLEEAVKDKDFHFINKTVQDLESFAVSRIDYAFFSVNHFDNPDYQLALTSFLKSLKKFAEDNPKSSPRIAFISSIELYKNGPRKEALENVGIFEKLEQAEVRLAKFVKDHKLNARIIRLGPIYGPRMEFHFSDPLISLIKASLLGKLQDEHTSLDFSTRALFIEDAIDLILKTVFSGATAQKIYDGISDKPVKVSELKQILLDPIWHESRGFTPTDLPPWPTPNLKRTIKELSWHPRHSLVSNLRKTIAYFEINGKDEIREDESPKVTFPSIELTEDKKKLLSETDLAKSSNEEEEQDDDEKGESANKKAKKESKFSLGKPVLDGGAFRKNTVIIIGLGIIMFALIFPFLSILVGAFSVRAHLINSKTALTKGDFDKAVYETSVAKSDISQIRQVVGSFAIVRNIKYVGERLDSIDKILENAEEGVDGVSHATKGMLALYKTTKIMSGEDRGEPKPLYETAQVELSVASRKISQTQTFFADPESVSLIADLDKSRVLDFQKKLVEYRELIEKAKTASYLLPEVTGIDSKKVYLVLLQNNMELRPGGGFIGSYARIEFENGRIKKISVDDIYNLDGNLKEHIEPPIEIKNDLGQKDWYLRDSNLEPDFPSAARQAEFFYNKEAGERVQGVFALDLTASAQLIDAVGGINLADYGEHITKDNLFEKAISHAEVNFFPGSQAKKNYLTTLQLQLFNKIFFLSNQNWPSIVSALGNSLEQKHLMIYMSDPEVFSYISSQNWSGLMPRQAGAIDGTTADFVAPVEANLGANKSNYYLERSYRLETSIGKQSEIYHHLVINYKNNSPSAVFPAGTYKNRFRIYLPNGTKLKKATLGESDITTSVTPFSDYGRSGFSMLVEIAPKEQKSLILDYQLPGLLSYKDNLNNYKLDIVKQPGTEADSFTWNLTFPINLTLQTQEGKTLSKEQEYEIVTNLSSDKTFGVKFKKK